MNKAAKDYYFHVGPSPEGVTVIITPTSYFDEIGCIDDQHCEIEELLPEWISEEMECMFLSSKSPEETRQELLNRNFIENLEFTDFCKNAFEVGNQILDCPEVLDINWLHAPLTETELKAVNDPDKGETW